MALTYNSLSSTSILIERTVSVIPNSYSETEQGFSDVYARNIDAVYRVCFSFLKNSADAEDLSQDTFLRYLDRDVKFESERHEKAWIIRTTINACKDHFKSAFVRRTVALDEAEAVAAPPVPDTEVLDALKKLPEQYRISLYLYYYEDYSAREIADVMGKTEANVTQYLSRGRRKLRELLEAERRQVV